MNLFFIILIALLGVVGYGVMVPTAVSAADDDTGDDDNDDTGNYDDGKPEPTAREKLLEQERNDYKKLADNFQNQLKELKGKLDNMDDGEELKSEVQNLQDQLKAERKQFQLTAALLAAGANPDALDDMMNNIDINSFNTKTVNNEELLDDPKKIANEIKESKPWYFSSKEKGRDIGGGGNPEDQDDDIYIDAAEAAKKRSEKKDESKPKEGKDLWAI